MHVTAQRPLNVQRQTELSKNNLLKKGSGSGIIHKSNGREGVEWLSQFISNSCASPEEEVPRVKQLQASSSSLSQQGSELSFPIGERGPL